MHVGALLFSSQPGTRGRDYEWLMLCQLKPGTVKKFLMSFHGQQTSQTYTLIFLFLKIWKRRIQIYNSTEYQSSCVLNIM